MTPDVQPLAEPTPSRRSWRRFSARGYLIFMTLEACCLVFLGGFTGWVANEMRQKRALCHNGLSNIHLALCAAPRTDPPPFAELKNLEYRYLKGDSITDLIPLVVLEPISKLSDMPANSGSFAPETGYGTGSRRP